MSKKNLEEINEKALSLMQAVSRAQVWDISKTMFKEVYIDRGEKVFQAYIDDLLRIQKSIDLRERFEFLPNTNLFIYKVGTHLEPLHKELCPGLHLIHIKKLTKRHRGRTVIATLLYPGEYTQDQIISVERCMLSCRRQDPHGLALKLYTNIHKNVNVED